MNNWIILKFVTKNKSAPFSALFLEPLVGLAFAYPPIVFLEPLVGLAFAYPPIVFLEPLVGFEPTTPRLQITCSGQLS